MQDNRRCVCVVPLYVPLIWEFIMQVILNLMKFARNRGASIPDLDTLGAMENEMSEQPRLKILWLRILKHDGVGYECGMHTYCTWVRTKALYNEEPTHFFACCHDPGVYSKVVQWRWVCGSFGDDSSAFLHTWQWQRAHLIITTTIHRTPIQGRASFSWKSKLYLRNPRRRHLRTT